MSKSKAIGDPGTTPIDLCGAVRAAPEYAVPMLEGARQREAAWAQ